jgi:hypothetical protein
LNVSLLTPDIPIELDVSMAAIPSATTMQERRLAYHWASTLWDGHSDVFENGTLYGGATRALGLGMLQNPRREPKALLQTFDWFSLLEPLDVPLEHLVTANQLPTSAIADAIVSGSYHALFHALHDKQPYNTFLRSHIGFLPGHCEQNAPDGAQVFIAPEREFGLAFIDGCKSWYGTKHWILQLCSRLPAGAYLIFQDFGWYTCFWISALISLLEEYFQLVGYIDCAYVWRLVQPLNAREIIKRYPDEPNGFDAQQYAQIYDPLAAAAYDRNDLLGECAALSQKAAALAYIDEKDRAVAIIEALLRRYEFLPLRRSYLLPARESPTYTPEGRVLLPPRKVRA